MMIALHLYSFSESQKRDLWLIMVCIDNNDNLRW